MNKLNWSTGKKLAVGTNVATNPLLSKESGINAGRRTFNSKVNYDRDFQEAVSTIKLKKGFCNYHISGYFQAVEFPLISQILALVFNTSTETSRFPDTWKISRVTQIIRGDKADKSN